MGSCAKTAAAEPEGEGMAAAAQETGLRMFNLRLPDAAAARDALESFQGPPWLRDAVAPWRQQYPEALDGALPTPCTGTNDIGRWTKPYLRTQVRSSGFSLSSQDSINAALRAQEDRFRAVAV